MERIGLSFVDRKSLFPSIAGESLHSPVNRLDPPAEVVDLPEDLLHPFSAIIAASAGNLDTVSAVCAYPLCYAILFW